ncbi:MAG: Replication factor C small subunit, partial [Promethearchaeota archaeon]
RQIMREIKKLNLNPLQLNELYTLIGDIDYRVSQGADERIQIIALLADMINKVKSKEEAV